MDPSGAVYARPVVKTLIISSSCARLSKIYGLLFAHTCHLSHIGRARQFEKHGALGGLLTPHLRIEISLFSPLGYLDGPQPIHFEKLSPPLAYSLSLHPIKLPYHSLWRNKLHSQTYYPWKHKSLTCLGLLWCLNTGYWLWWGSHTTPFWISFL